MKLLLVGDMHFGEKGNSPKFNAQLGEFTDWICSEFSHMDQVIQLGDWFHHRSKIDTITLSHSIENAKKLSDAFGSDRVKVLVGNHDMPFLHTFDSHSLNCIKPYVTVIEEITPMDNCLLTPWITDGEMWDELVNMSSDYDYCFGHFELNSFMVNDHYKMEHGYSPAGLKKFTHVFSGHYHSKQTKGNITYAGTPLPITMNEANEPHGVIELDTVTGDVTFHEYSKVKVVSIPYDQLEKLDDCDPENTSVRIEFPDTLEDETVITDVQEYLESKNFNEAKIKYRGSKAKELLDTDTDSIEEVENIDAVVIDFLSNSTTIDGINTELLGKFYQQAIKEGVSD